MSAKNTANSKAADKAAEKARIVAEKARIVKESGQYGHIGRLTTEQKEILEKFKLQAKASDIEFVKYTVETFDQCCLRFLKARQFDLEKSLLLLIECISKLEEMKADEWAKKSPDECGKCDIEALKNFYPHTVSGFDKMNRPVLFEHTGGTNK